VSEGRLLNEDDKGAIVFGSQVPYHFYNPRAVGRNRVFIIGGKNSEDPPVNVFEDRLIMTFDYFYGESHANQQEVSEERPTRFREWEFSKKAENTTIPLLST